MQPTKQEIQNEVENYIAVNGETGGWGEPMRDEIGVQILSENLADRKGIELTNETREEIRKALTGKYR
jgi:hypothetical protein